MESDAVVRFVITLILFQLLGIEIPACVCCHPVYTYMEEGEEEQGGGLVLHEPNSGMIQLGHFLKKIVFFSTKKINFFAEPNSGVIQLGHVGN